MQINLGIRRVRAFTLKEMIGFGSEADVFREVGRCNQPLSVKIASDRLEHSNLLIENEAHILSGLDHPNIIKYMGHGKIDSKSFLATRLVEGVDLEDYIKAHFPMPEAQACSLVKQIASALSYVHSKGLVHADLAVKNILIAEDQAILLDFSFSRPEKSYLAFEENGKFIMGTLSFISLDRLYGDPPSVKDDIFALGLIFLQMFTGRRAITDHDTETMHLDQGLLHLKIDGSTASPAIKSLIRKMVFTSGDNLRRADEIIEALK